MGVPARRGAAALRKAWADAVDNRMPLYMSAPLLTDFPDTVEGWATGVVATQQQRRHNRLSDKESSEDEQQGADGGDGGGEAARPAGARRSKRRRG